MATTTAGSGRVDPAEVFVQYRPNRRRRRAILAGLAIGLLVLVGLNTVRGTVGSPEAAVNAYFQALADRDLSAAFQVLDPAAGNLPSPAVLSADGYLPPTDVDLREVTVDGATATVTVAFTVDGQRHTAGLALARDEGVVDRFSPRWRVVDGIRPLWLGEIPAEVLINGEPVWAPSPGGPWSVLLPFGGYQVSLPEDPLWEPQAVTGVVGPEPARPVALPLVARAQVRAEVEDQVRAALDDCAALAELRPPGCPFQVRGIVNPNEVAWEITRYPDVSLTAVPDGFGQVQLRVGTAQAGRAAVSGTHEFLRSELPFADEVSFTVAGVVTFQDGTVRFEPDW